jgi:hypothetical protein
MAGRGQEVASFIARIISSVDLKVSRSAVNPGADYLSIIFSSLFFGSKVLQTIFKKPNFFRCLR